MLEDFQGGPILPFQYNAECSLGGLGFEEICVAWNKYNIEKVGECRAILALDGGALLCPLKINQQIVQVVSVHPSAWNESERIGLLRSVWYKLIDRNLPAIVGGDFNTERETFGFKEFYPYPLEFGTVFGFHSKGYGRFKPGKSFFGMYQSKGSNIFEDFMDAPLQAVSTVFGGKIDHIFTNFGVPSRNDDAVGCKNGVCVGNILGYDWGSPFWSIGFSAGAKIDHLPILTHLKWD